MKKAIFLDRDGTLIEERNYISKIEDVVLFNNTIEGLKLLQENGYLLFITTNQSGVARGYFDEDTVKKINDYFNDILKNKGINIEKIYYCPHHKEGIVEKYTIDCNCRKPKTGLIEQAKNDYDIDLENSYVIGDKLVDMQLAKNCNCKAILVLTGYGEEESKKESALDFKIVNDLLQAANFVLRN